MSAADSGHASETNRRRVGRILLIIGRVLLAVIFLFAAYAKMKPQGTMPWTMASVRTSLSMFAMGVDSYQMLPLWAVSPFAHFLPIFELVLGLWLLSGIGLRAGSIVSTLAVLVFIAAMWSAYLRGLTISCGCFGPGEQVGPLTLIRDGLTFLPLSLAVMIGAFLLHRGPKPTSAPEASGAPQHAA
jgi:uncharacterized membrane protein YphA (DoxX/SURF4 family)